MISNGRLSLSFCITNLNTAQHWSAWISSLPSAGVSPISSCEVFLQEKIPVSLICVFIENQNKEANIEICASHKGISCRQKLSATIRWKHSSKIACVFSLHACTHNLPIKLSKALCITTSASSSVILKICFCIRLLWIKNRVENCIPILNHASLQPQDVRAQVPTNAHSSH